MEAVLMGLDEAVGTRQALLWTLTSTALRRLRVHARNLPASMHLSHTHRPHGAISIPQASHCPVGSRPYWDKPNRPYWDKPNRLYWDKPNRLYWDKPNRLYWDKPSRLYWDKPNRPYWDKPNRLYWDKPSRPYWDKPNRPYWDKPSRPTERLVGPLATRRLTLYCTGRHAPTESVG
ncbi:hypothetical protein EYF80_057337 [Liparis tanakae]|uniref:Uncharacterized protein n=1 Tax=Liparis tanakae TaxID=230148 RepID=A0A4Z2EW99_9TELE|nr:hypothetical protein EYF80_057337 [Liparis tanakae]